VIESYSTLFQQTITKRILAFPLLIKTKQNLAYKTVKLPPMFQMRSMNSAVGQNIRLQARYIHSWNTPPPKRQWAQHDHHCLELVLEP